MENTVEDDRRPFALVVDDDLLILMNAVDILTGAGFRALEAHNVDAAEAVLVEYADEITLLFTDVQMPGSRNGFDLAQLAARSWPDIRIIVSSGLAKAEDGALPPQAVFIGKPFSPDVIYDELQRLLPDGAKPKPLRQRVREH
jgi:CheY-like chemotaxis protein